MSDRKKRPPDEDDETSRDEGIMSADDTGMVRNEAQIVYIEETAELEER